MKIIAGKMGKRYNNGVAPEEVAARHSVDSYRCYMMFLGPLNATSPWREEPIVGIDRFLSAVWNMAHGLLADEVDQSVDTLVHRTIRDVTTEIANLRFNTAVAFLMKLLNALTDQPGSPARAHVETLVRLLAPFAPHLAEEAYRTCFTLPSGVKTVARAPWPEFDSEKTVLPNQRVVVQVNGKLRASFDVKVNTPDETIQSIAELNPAVLKSLEGRTIRKVIHVNKGDGCLINFVAG